MWLRDLSANGKLLATGKDRVRFLNGLFSNDVAALRPGGGCHAAMVSVKGRTVADAILLCDAEALLIDLAPELLDKVHQALERHLIVDEVVLDDRSAALDEVGVYGEGARPAIESLVGALPELPLYGHVTVGGTRVVAVRDLGLSGFRLVGGAREKARALDGRWLDEATAEILRVEAGQPRYGVDMGEDYLPMESLLDDAISHEKGCYMGQEVIARVTARGQINKRLCGLRLEASVEAQSRGAAAAGARISAEGREEAGTITSSVVSPRFGAIALGYLHRTLWVPGTVVTVHEPGGERRATVAALPFA